ncbi:MAG: hypothetical protein PVF58_11705 [Candidatus Methanofastidiosia archaeon]
MEKKKPQIVICPRCKNRIPENQTVCHICGAKLPKLKKKNKAKIIIIAITIAAFLVVAVVVIVYSWASGFTSEKTGAESGEAEQLVLENQVYKDGVVEVCIRNPLSNPSTIDAEYRNGSIIKTGIGQKLDGESVTCFNLQDSNYQPGDDCMLVTEEGTQIKFRIKGSV